MAKARSNESDAADSQALIDGLEERAREAEAQRACALPGCHQSAHPRRSRATALTGGSSSVAVCMAPGRVPTRPPARPQLRALRSRGACSSLEHSQAALSHEVLAV